MSLKSLYEILRWAMDIWRYHCTIMLIIIFSVTESELVKEAQTLQKPCDQVLSNLSGEYANYRQFFTFSSFSRDVTKWKLSRLVPIKSKFVESVYFTTTPHTKSYNNESKEVSRSCKDSSKIKLTSKNSLIGLKYWNIPQGHYNIEEFNQFAPNNKNGPNKKNALPEKYVRWGFSQNSSIDSTVKTATAITIDSQPVKRKSNIEFYYWDNVDEDLKTKSSRSLDLNPFKGYINCSENNSTKVLFADVPVTLQNERVNFAINSKPPLNDTLLQFSYGQTEDLKVSTDSSVSSLLIDTTPNNIYTLLALSSSSLNNIQKSIMDVDSVNIEDNYKIRKIKNQVDSDYSSDDAQNAFYKTISGISPFSINSKAAPETLTTIILNNKDPLSLDFGNNYFNRFEQKLDRNETKFNKRSLENFQTIEDSSHLNTTSGIKSSADDKVRFFEMYDAHTYVDNKVFYTKNKSIEQLLASTPRLANILRYRNSYLVENNITSEKNVLDVTQANSTDEKKNIDVFGLTRPYQSINTDNENFDNQTESISMTVTKEATLSEGKENANHITKKPPTNMGNRYSKKRVSPRSIFKISTKKHKPKSELLLHKSFKTSWTTYPFVAAYIHEPLQIHCDAASISAHWLIAAASCMSRMYATNNDPLEGRSAYVSYCSNDWWRPELIGYVKYSVVHPQFNPRHQVKRRLFNIGLIRVANSMSANCPVWRPVSLSHQIMTKLEGVEGVAVGWGLDRITSSQFNAMETTWKPLSMFTGLVFTNVCPGNLKVGKPKTAIEEQAIKNIYCLSLPPYSGETRDPTHGSILLIRNKLVGLYLQEERRVFGTQSAQYTSIWKLLPWIFENAKEPENADNFSFDIL